MTDSRPDPATFLDRIKQDEALAARGKLKIFFGASAGVGKTFAMLSSAAQQRAQGRDVIVGIIETHGRKETEALLAGLECLPLKDMHYRDRVLAEFDLDAALARKPNLILVDELAHSNVSGSRHPKRWQDIDELLAAGIDVHTTVNVQHLESLNDVVGGITGIRVWETVPDHVFDAADEVVLVDLPPDELLQRLKEGKIYLAQQAERAVQNFFRKGNLIALRELALRRTADRVDDEMLQYRRDRSVRPVWQTRESLLACIGPAAGGERVVRGAARIAAKLDIPWHTIYIETPALRHLQHDKREQVFRNLKLAEGLGAETATLSGSEVAEAIVGYARDHNLSRIVIGREEMRSRWPWQRSLAQRIGERAVEIDVIQIGREAHRQNRVERHPGGDGQSHFFERLRAPWMSFAASGMYCAIATAVSTPLHSLVDLANIAMIFLLAVVVSAMRHGFGPAVAAAFINVAAFDFFFVPPRLTFVVSDAQYLLTFGVMLIVGLVIARLMSDLKFQARIASRREQRVQALYEMSRDLSGGLLPQQIAEIVQRFADIAFGASAAIVPAGDDNRLQAPIDIAGKVPLIDMSICQWTFDHDAEAGCGSDTLPASPARYVPLKAPMRTRGVLVLEPREARRLEAPEQRRLLDTFARLVAISLERMHYVSVAQTTTLQMESERLRNSLLAAISHDLRTPLSVLIGLTEALRLTQPQPSVTQADIVDSMHEELLRINAQVSNLLDMARLESGTVKLNREWQPLEEVVGSALKAATPILAGHRIETRLPEDLPLLEFDAVLMERVFANLIDNAVKYTPPGSTLSIGAAAVDAQTVEIWVEDNGLGLPPGREEDIFKKFERGRKEGTTPGVGLGLAICRAIVEAHGGRIHAEHRSDGGARFVFALPRGNPPSIPELKDENDE